MAFRVNVSEDLATASRTPRKGEYVTVTPVGAVDARIAFGNDAIVAGATDILVRAGTSRTFGIPSNATHIAVLAAASSVNLAWGTDGI